jgi:hypothetical protein
MVVQILFDAKTCLACPVRQRCSKAKNPGGVPMESLVELFCHVADFCKAFPLTIIDSTSLDVCLNQRILSHKFFARLAERRKTSIGWLLALNCTWSGRISLRKHAIVDTVIDQLKKYLPDRAFTPSQCWKFIGQSEVWLDCLCSPTQETFVRYGRLPVPPCLTRTHV